MRASDRAARRSRRRRLSFITAATVSALALATGGVYAVQQRAGNQSSQAVESSVALAQDASSLRVGDPAGALWLSLAAYNSSKTSQARTELYNSLTTPYPLTLPGGGRGVVDNVAYSRDGTTAAAVWQSGAVRIWRVSDPQRPVLLATLRVRAGGINGLAFSPDGTVLAVHALGSLELWRLESGKHRPALLSGTPVTEAVPHPKGVPPWLPVAFSPDGRVVATGAGDGRFRMWNLSNLVRPVLTAAVTVSSRPLTALSFSPDGDTLAVASEDSDSTGRDGRVELWDAREPAKPVFISGLGVTSALAIAFSPVGHLLVAVGSNNDVYVWNIGNRQKPVSIQVDNNDSGGNALYSVTFHPGSDVFVTADANGKTESWSESPGEGFTDAGTGSLPDSAIPNSVAFSPNGEDILTGDFGGSVKLWTTLTPLLHGSFDIGFGGTPYNATGTVMLTENQIGSTLTSHVQLWDVSDPLHPQRDATLPGAWNTGAFLPGGNTLITFADTNTVFRLWNATKPHHPVAGAELPDNATSGFTPATWSANDNGLLLVAGPGYVRLWNVRNTSRPVLESTIKVNPAGSTFLTDQFIAVNVKPSPARSELRLWDITNPRHPVPAGEVRNGDPESAVFYSPSRNLLTEAAVVDNTDTAVWSLLHHKPSVLAARANMDPSGLNALGDDTWVALTRDDKTLNVWDVSNPRKPSVTAALPVGSGYGKGGLYTADTPAGWLAGIDFTPPNTATENKVAYLVQVRGDGRAVSNYVQLPISSASLITFSPDGKYLAANFDTSDGSGFDAFYPRSFGNTDLGILYPLDSDSVYEHLCSIATQTPPDPSWSKYLPATYYRPACS